MPRDILGVTRFSQSLIMQFAQITSTVHYLAPRYVPNLQGTSGAPSCRVNSKILCWGNWCRNLNLNSQPKEAICQQGGNLPATKDMASLLKKSYLVAYNAASAVAWATVLGRVVAVFWLRGPSLVPVSVDTFVRNTQSFAALELVHSVLGQSLSRCIPLPCERMLLLMSSFLPFKQDSCPRPSSRPSCRLQAGCKWCGVSHTPSRS